MEDAVRMLYMHVCVLPSVAWFCAADATAAAVISVSRIISATQHVITYKSSSVDCFTAPHSPAAGCFSARQSPAADCVIAAQSSTADWVSVGIICR